MPARVVDLDEWLFALVAAEAVKLRLMGPTKFALICLGVIGLLLLGLGVQRYQACQEKGGKYCVIGGARGPFVRPPLR